MTRRVYLEDAADIDSFFRHAAAAMLIDITGGCVLKVKVNNREPMAIMKGCMDDFDEFLQMVRGADCWKVKEEKGFEVETRCVVEVRLLSC